MSDYQRPNTPAAEHVKQHSDWTENEDHSGPPAGGLELFESEKAVGGAPAGERGAPAGGPFPDPTVKGTTVEHLRSDWGRRSVVKSAIAAAVSDAMVASSRALSAAEDRLRRVNEHLRQIVMHQKRQLGKQWALPLLLLVVLIESTWLAIVAFRSGEAERVATVSTTDTEPKLPSSTEKGAGQISSDKTASLIRNGTTTRGTTGTRPAVTPKSVSAAVPGSLTIAIPFQVEVYESGRFVGIGDGSSIPLSPGSHQLEFVNESLRYRASTEVTVTSGRTTQVTLNLPTGTLHLNATPWAEVFVDGESVGETPLSNVHVPIGPRIVVFRHPQLGEQTRNVLVAAGSTTRLGIDLRK